MVHISDHASHLLFEFPCIQYRPFVGVIRKLHLVKDTPFAKEVANTAMHIVHSGGYMYLHSLKIMLFANKTKCKIPAQLSFLEISVQLNNSVVHILT